MTRRDLLGKLGVGLGAIGVGLAASNPKRSDWFNYRGFDIKWGGWQRATNQDIELGYWYAYGSDDVIFAVCTMGICAKVFPFCIFDTTWTREWPAVTGKTSETVKAVVKANALQRLLGVLEAQ